MTASSQEPERPAVGGYIAAMMAGVFLGSAVAVARFAYDGGASGIVVACGRTILMVIGIGAYLLITGRGFRMDRRHIPMVAINGVLMGMMTYGNIGAVEFISVGLAALLFFTFPVMIAVLVAVLRIEPVSPLKLFAIVFAFTGLVMMLGGSVGDSDWRGVAFSMTAALATAANAVLVARHFRGFNVFVMTFHFSWVALVMLLLIAVFLADVRFPETDSGWAGVIGVAVLQASGMPMYVFALSSVGALRAGMFNNIQPLISIAEAWVLFGELLGTLQALGGLVVLSGIALMQWANTRGDRRSLTLATAADQMPATPILDQGERDR